MADGVPENAPIGLRRPMHLSKVAVSRRTRIQLTDPSDHVKKQKKTTRPPSRTHVSSSTHVVEKIKTPIIAFTDLETTIRPETLRKLASFTDPTEAKPADGVYVPPSRRAFGNFMIQTFIQYSPFMSRVVELQKKGRMDSLTATSTARSEFAEVKAHPNPDACRLRDPNKVETFYYQKLVRDMMSRGTPYRGVLTYHGLGSGKSCTSIAAAEALYWGPLKKIYVLTPATLADNYRNELGKCGFFPLRQNNYWVFMRIGVRDPAAFAWATQGYLALPEKTILEAGGAWIPDPTKPSNWDTLSSKAQASILKQQTEHMAHRFKFIHYNGVDPAILAQLATDSVFNGKSMFDDAVVIVEEIHNLVRTVNGTKLAGKTLANFISEIEPREFSWSMPHGREVPGYRYPRGYTLYRLLCNAVGVKLIGLSATPMINYAQELAVLMNIIGGEYRTAIIQYKNAMKSAVQAWAAKHPEIDYVDFSEDGKTFTVSPVPYGFTKVVGETSNEFKGFLRSEDGDIPSVEMSNERNMDVWAAKLIGELEAMNAVKKGSASAAMKIVMDARRARVDSLAEMKPESVEISDSLISTNAKEASDYFTLVTFPVLPDDQDTFVDNFVDRSTLEIKNANVLKARTQGLVSYYRGGGDDLMPRTTKSEKVLVPMSDFMFKKYVEVRQAEIDADRDKKKPGTDKPKPTGPVDLYALATKNVQTGFLAGSRAACNWVFPEDVERPKIGKSTQKKLLGLMDKKGKKGKGKGKGDEEGHLNELDEVEVEVYNDEEETPLTVNETDAAAFADDVKSGGVRTVTFANSSVAAEEIEKAKDTMDEPLDEELSRIVGTLMSGIEAHADNYLRENLATYSPKYAEILKNIRLSPGPVLVYSNFKTLEGLGIFAAALRAAEEKFMPMDIQKNAAGEWEIPEIIMRADRSRPRYILYTGDIEKEKRTLLLKLYNANLRGLPGQLAEQCRELLAGAPDNRDGRVCKVFMITQSGAEGISLANTRQVHIMEPYWNNVRLQQVVGRAIRLCSHMNLDWAERTVEVFTYLSTFTTEQKTEAQSVMTSDGARTTDEVIFDIATKKQTLADGLNLIVQSSAVDCELHTNEHTNPRGEFIQCFKFSTGVSGYMFHPDWRRDLADAAGVRVARAPTPSATRAPVAPTAPPTAPPTATRAPVAPPTATRAPTAPTATRAPVAPPVATRAPTPSATRALRADAGAGSSPVKTRK